MISADRVKETTTTTGTGTVNLGGASTGFQGFVAGAGDGAIVHYCIFGGSEWEVGIGTVTDASPDTLSRDTVLASSNAGALVNFSAGTKDVFVTVPADLINSLMAMAFAPGGGRFDAPPASPSAFDDEFRTVALDAKWSSYATAHASFTVTPSKFGDYYCMEGTGNSTYRHTIGQVLSGFPAGTPMQVTLKCSMSARKNSSTTRIQLMLSDNVVPETGNFTTWLIYFSSSEYAAMEYNGSIRENSGIQMQEGGNLYLHLQRDASNNADYWISRDGETWIRRTRQTNNFDFTRMYLILDGADSSGMPTRLMVDWIRVDDPRFTLPV